MYTPFHHVRLYYCHVHPFPPCTPILLHVYPFPPCTPIQLHVHPFHHVRLYYCMCTSFTTTESIHDSYNIDDISISGRNDNAQQMGNNALNKEYLDPCKLLKSMKTSNINRLIIGQLNNN